MVREESSSTSIPKAFRACLAHFKIPSRVSTSMPSISNKRKSYFIKLSNRFAESIITKKSRECKGFFKTS